MSTSLGVSILYVVIPLPMWCMMILHAILGPLGAIPGLMWAKPCFDWLWL